jgi:hypothetical protein
MPDMTSISILANSLNAAVNIAKTMIDLRDWSAFDAEVSVGRQGIEIAIEKHRECRPADDPGAVANAAPDSMIGAPVAHRPRRLDGDEGRILQRHALPHRNGTSVWSFLPATGARSCRRAASPNAPSLPSTRAAWRRGWQRGSWRGISVGRHR